MLHYPLDPTHARILLASFENGCASEIIDILSLVNSGNLFIDRSSDRDAAAESRTKFVHRDGDHLTALNVFRAYLAILEGEEDPNDADSDNGDVNFSVNGNSKRGASGKGEGGPGAHKGKRGKNSNGGGGGGGGSKSEIGKWCKDNHVNQRTLAQAMKIRQQLRGLAQKDGKDWKITCGSEVEVVTKSLLAGLFMNTAVIQSDGTYRQAAGNLVSAVVIFRSSLLSRLLLLSPSVGIQVAHATLRLATFLPLRFQGSTEGKVKADSPDGQNTPIIRTAEPQSPRNPVRRARKSSHHACTSPLDNDHSPNLVDD